MAETVTIVSSTIKPSANKNAKRVRKLIVMPKNCMKKKALKNVSGTVIEEINAWRKPKNKNRHKNTKIIVERNSRSKSPNCLLICSLVFTNVTVENWFWY